MQARQNLPIVFFDGGCNLCHAGVRYILRHDKNGDFLFASLQSELAERLGLARADAGESMLLWQNGRVRTHSDAALAISAKLDAPHSWLRHGRVLPRWLRDAIYRLVARTRFRLWGRAEQCELLEATDAQRFVGDRPDFIASALSEEL